MIGDAFAHVLGDIADASPFLHRDFAAVKFHRSQGVGAEGIARS